MVVATCADYAAANGGTGTAMKFVVKKSSNGEYRFNMVASNGQTVATSEGYKEKRSALATIESIKKNAAAAATDDQAQ
jgi:uncharacterized protein YegP (UPF0339 family)